jgi:gliding motility-associated-like protein
VPVASHWTLLDGTRVFNPVSTTVASTYVGWYSDGICTVSDTIKIHTVAPITFSVRLDTTIFKGDGVYLWSISDAGSGAYCDSTIWTSLSRDTSLVKGPQTVFPTEEIHLYEAKFDHICGPYYDTVRIYVLPPPEVIPLDSIHIRIESFNGCFGEDDGWVKIIINDKPTHPPFTYYWWDDDSEDSFRTDLSADTTYTVTIKDALDSIVTLSFTPKPAPPINIDEIILIEPTNEYCDGGRIEIKTVIGGTPPYRYYWEDGGSTPNRTGLKAGLHNLTILDVNNCRGEFEIDLECIFRGHLRVNLFISPNGDGHNDFLKIKNIEKYLDNRLTILNAYGELVWQRYHYDNVKVVWDGKNDRGHVLPDGVYYYILEVEGEQRMAGWILMKVSKN